MIVLSDQPHPYPFDPAYGFGLDALLQVGPPSNPPADFAEFWRGLFERASAVPIRPQVGPLIRQTRDGLDLHTVTFGSVGGVRLGGWLVLPSDGKVDRGFVIGHGYGGRDAPDLVLPASRAAAFFPVARGLGVSSLIPGVPSVAAEHVLHGIESRDTYIHAGCAADVWCAASALIEAVPAAAQRLDYVGGSFGGGIGALALPWDARFHSAHLTVPSFGNHPLRVTLPCLGSGAAVRERYLVHPDVLDVLAYFDAATAARHLRIPVQVAAALFDPSVPPPGQFSVYNGLAGPKQLHVLAAGHHDDYPQAAEEQEKLLAARAEFFR
ncbi:acetylxylan esterase [Catenulispora pinisilvae]|uniref:acetylxylan esterase n=1 Tax=Catenulispora pinisilvae TaxID=2705253 RepID=UPI002B265A67|nr:acetylxylan esterase [Catenulispora pinisilvae]